jgi:serine/threonine protein phosphatase PrpC
MEDGGRSPGSQEDTMLVERTTPVALGSGACSDRGLRRHNADATSTSRDASTGRLAFAVADGIGDTQAAAHAARLAAEVAARTVHRTGTVGALLAARDVLDGSPADAVLITATLLPPHLGGGFSVSWAGDARAYHWDGEVLVQLTTDHTVAEFYRRHGRAPNSRMEHVVTNTVRSATVQTVGHVRTPGGRGRLVLTTDGVHRRLGHDELAEIVSGVADSGEAAEILVSAALRAGSTDNVTALVADARA